MQKILTRLGALSRLAPPLVLTFAGVTLLSLGVAYLLIAAYRDAPPAWLFYLTLQFLPPVLRSAVLIIAGLALLALGIWTLSGVAVIPLDGPRNGQREMLLGYRSTSNPPQLAVLSGGPGIMVLAGLGQRAARLVCITPAQDPVEYYYRAASLFTVENVIYVAPTAAVLQVFAELDDGSRWNIKHNIAHDEQLASRQVVQLSLADAQGAPLTQVAIFRQAREALRQADAIILGPGSLFESIIPDLLIPEIREAIRESKARTIYVCNLMTEPGLTTGFSVADHIRQIARYGGFTPNYVLVNAQRIEPEIRQIYEAANQKPVYLSPEEYEETVVGSADQAHAHDLVIEGAIVIEADLASSVVQLTASINNPDQRQAYRVLRHDPEKLTAAIMGILGRT